MGTKVSPLPRRVSLSPSRPPDEPEKEGYKIVLKFNEKRQLTDVNFPGDLNLFEVNHHLAVVSLWLFEKIKEEVENSKEGGKDK